MKKRRKKPIIPLLVIVMLLLYVSYQKNALEYKQQTPAIKQNQNYGGTGQIKIENQDGYFTTFTTYGENQKTYIEYKQNGNASWKNNSYWGGSMAENGCGITVMSIILSGYQKNVTPEDLRKQYYPEMDYEMFSRELSSTFGIENSGFYYDSYHLSEHAILEQLKCDRPIIICVWNKPTANRWTTASHYMALLAADNQGMVYVSNPNGGESDSKSSGWYDIKEVTPYIAKAIYIEQDV